jgi:hypothetical protein
MTERSEQFRVYRVTASVPHINLQTVDSSMLYTVYQSGYGELQEQVDELATGDLVTATVEGDPAAEDEPWRIRHLERVGGVEMEFAIDTQPPDIAREAWTAGETEPTSTVLSEDGTAVGACVVQPREPLPNEAFVPSILTGLLPLERQFDSVSGVGDPAAEALFIDPAPTDARSFSTPYGVALLFTERGRSLADRFREQYDCPRGTDTRPDFDPYGL